MTAIGRGTSTPPGSPERQSDAPEGVRRAHTPPRDVQAPAPLRQRTEAGYAEGAPRLRAALPQPSSSLPALRPELSIASLSWRSGEASVERPPGTPTGSLPSLPSGSHPGPTLSFLESDVAARSEPLPGSPSPATASRNEADFDEVAPVPAPADMVQTIHDMIELLTQLAAGTTTKTAVAAVASRGFFNTAFDVDGQLSPRDKNIQARLIHQKLDSLRAGTQTDRDLATRFDAAMAVAGKPAWDKTTQLLEGLVEAARELDPTRALAPGETRPKKARLQERFDSRNLGHVCEALKTAMNAQGVFKRNATNNNVKGVLSQVERMRRSREPAHLEALGRWDALMERQASGPQHVVRTETAPRVERSPNLPALAARAETFTEALDKLKPQEVGLLEAGGRSGNTGFRSAFSSYGEITERGSDLLAALKASPHPNDLDVAARLEQASQRAIQRNRESIAATLGDLTIVIQRLKDGTYQTKREAAARFEGDPDKLPIHSYINDALLKSGQLNPQQAQSLVNKFDWLRRNGEENHQQAVVEFEAALNQSHHAYGRPPATSLDPADYTGEQRLQRRAERRGDLPPLPPGGGGRAGGGRSRGRGRGRAARGRGREQAAMGPASASAPQVTRPSPATPSGSVGSVAGGMHRPGAPRAASAARSGIGAGFDAGDEVQSRRAASPRFDLRDPASMPGTPLWLPALSSPGLQGSGSRFTVLDASALPSLHATSLPSLSQSVRPPHDEPGTLSFARESLTEGRAPQLSRSASSSIPQQPRLPDLNEPSEGAPDFEALPSISGGRLELGSQELEVRSRPASSAVPSLSTRGLDPSATLLAMIRSRVALSAAPPLSTERLDLSVTLLAMQRSNALAGGLQQIIDRQSPENRAALRPHVPAMMAIDRALHAADLPPLMDQLRNNDLRMLQNLPLDQNQNLALTHFIQAQRTSMRPAAPGSDR